jgi:hypothetical protein
MQYRDIAGVRLRVDQAVAGLPGEPADAEDVFSRLEMVCIQVLDSECEQYLPGQLQELLMSYLYIRQIELGLLPDIDPKEE